MTDRRFVSGTHRELLETLRTAQRFGVLGSRPVEHAVAHAHAFVERLDGVSGRVVDLGSGGGLPGLVIAVDRPDLELVLVDRREKRTDLLERAVLRLGLSPQVTVRCADAELVASDEPRSFQAVTARGFGPPATTLRLAARLVAPGGRILVSEPPSGDRWDRALVQDLGLRLTHQARVAVFEAAT